MQRRNVDDHLFGWHGEQLDIQNNENTIERSSHWIMYGEQWDFENNEPTE